MSASSQRVGRSTKSTGLPACVRMRTNRPLIELLTRKLSWMSGPMRRLSNEIDGTGRHRQRSWDRRKSRRCAQLDVVVGERGTRGGDLNRVVNLFHRIDKDFAAAILHAGVIDIIQIDGHGQVERVGRAAQGERKSRS